MRDDEHIHRTRDMVTRGKVVGHNALYRSAPYKGIYETGAGVIHKDYRGGRKLFTEMVVHGIDAGVRRFGVEVVFGEPVCNHPISQKLTRKLGHITMAVEVDLMPAAAYVKEKSARGRVTTLLDFRTYRSRPHPIYLPRVYQEFLEFIYTDFDDAREMRVSRQTPPASARTRIDVQYFDFAQVARMAVWQTGADFAAVFAGEEKSVFERGASVIQAWINLGQPWNAVAVDFLREKGYFIGGALPRWFDTDGLLMMKIRHRPHWEDMQIHYNRARKITAMVKKDWKRSCRA